MLSPKLRALQTETTKAARFGIYQGAKDRRAVKIWSAETS
jgi:hypothetical protein